MSGKADDAGGLAPGKDGNETRCKKDRKDVKALVGYYKLEVTLYMKAVVSGVLYSRFRKTLATE
ncbi:MAG: hypothetical protein PHR24_06515 [Oscillospiraceae bacterium]|nr:hypothetical protein [Oscillospiraceae bacterium]MDD4546929.1 hypothetical protein [Oscillospiraceae bacterium]